MVQQINANNAEIKVPTQGNPIIELKPLNDENSCEMKSLNGNLVNCRINNISNELDFIDSNVSPSREVKNGSVPEAQQRQCNKNKFEVSVNSVGLYTNPVSTDSLYVHYGTQGPEGIQVSCPSTLKTIYTKKSERVLKVGKKPKKRYENAGTFIPENIDNYFGNKSVSEVITLINQEEKTPELVEKQGKSKNKKKKNKHGKNNSTEKNNENEVSVKDSDTKQENSDNTSVEANCECVSVDVSVNLMVNGKLTQTVTSTSSSPANESTNVNVSTTLPTTIETSSIENDFMIVSKNKKRNLNNNISNEKKQKVPDNYSDTKKKVDRNNSNAVYQKNRNNRDGNKKENYEKAPHVEAKTIIKQSATVEDRENEGKACNYSSQGPQNTWAHIARPKNNLNGCNNSGSTGNSCLPSVEAEKKRVSKDSGKKLKQDDKIVPSVLKVLAQHKNSKTKSQLSPNSGFLKVTTLNKQVLQIPLSQRINKKPSKLEVTSEHYEYVKFLQNAWNDSFKKYKVVN
uniref:Serine/threonine-protein kinase n=1 Tax=Strongyloides papillosus TaxID=174720 RepID=A0A0N5B526_STREA